MKKDFPENELLHVAFKRNRYIRSLTMFTNRTAAERFKACREGDSRHSDGEIVIITDTEFKAFKKNNKE